eukprot:m.75366 g.75366  ORF g.75366 m.75366 type:complete len:99 (-) comp12448_c0_seq2:165-461(-)
MIISRYNCCDEGQDFNIFCLFCLIFHLDCSSFSILQTSVCYVVQPHVAILVHPTPYTFPGVAQTLLLALHESNGDIGHLQWKAFEPAQKQSSETITKT